MAKEAGDELFTIEQLKEKQNIDDCVFSGIKAANSWAEGKEISESKFTSAVRNFLKQPIGGEDNA